MQLIYQPFQNLQLWYLHLELLVSFQEQDVDRWTNRIMHSTNENLVNLFSLSVGNALQTIIDSLTETVMLQQIGQNSTITLEKWSKKSSSMMK